MAAPSSSRPSRPAGGHVGARRHGGRPYLGISLKVLSALSFTVMSAGVKSLADRYPTGEIVFFRSFFAILPLLVWLGWQGPILAAVRTRNLRGHLLRSIIGACGMFAGFAALSFLPLSDAVAIGYASPLLVVVLAALVLRERVQGYRWAGVIVGFLGVLIMLAPHLQFGGSGFASSTARCSRAWARSAPRRRRSRSASSPAPSAPAPSCCTSSCSPRCSASPPGARLAHARPRRLRLFVLVGILGGIGQILLTESYRYGDASWSRRSSTPRCCGRCCSAGSCSASCRSRRWRSAAASWRRRACSWSGASAAGAGARPRGRGRRRPRRLSRRPSARDRA